MLWHGSISSKQAKSKMPAVAGWIQELTATPCLSCSVSV